MTVPYLKGGQGRTPEDLEGDTLSLLTLILTCIIGALIWATIYYLTT